VNKSCADCGRLNPLWVDINFSVFICTECSGIHRRMKGGNRVKSIRMGTWDNKSLEKIELIDNQKANVEYEKNVPSYLIKPIETDSYATKTIWIQSKYRNGEALTIDKNSFIKFETKPILKKIYEKEGLLLRKKKTQWKPYYFWLKEGNLLMSKSKTSRKKTTISVLSVREITSTYRFEVVSPTRIYQLQGSNEEDQTSWIEAIESLSEK